jgi:hypothetical protein
VKNTAQLRDVCLAAARLFGWDGNAHPSVTYYGDDNRQVILCDENKRKQLIEQRQRLLEAESNGKVIEIEAAAPGVALPAPETQPEASAATANGIVAQDQSPVAQDPTFQHMASIGNAESWKPSEPEHHAGSFGPHPEEIY